MLFGFSFNLNAALIEATIDTANDGFTDTVTGITYWDIGKFNNMRSADVVSAGYTLASFATADQLFDNIITAYPLAAGTRYDAFSVMGRGHSSDWIWFKWDDGIASESDDGGYIYSYSDNKYIFNNIYGNSDYSMGGLVVASQGDIPVPAPLALLGLGLIAIGFTRKRKA